MTFCGYNGQIGIGLNQLLAGMASAMQEKAEVVGNPVQALDNEIQELDIMINVMKNKGTVQDMFVALNILAKHLFLEIRREIIKSPDTSILILCEKIGNAFIAAVRDADEYRENLESENPILDNTTLIQRVGLWVNKNSNYPSYTVV